MTIIRRVLATIVPASLGMMLLASTASATTITTTFTVYGNIPSFTIGSGGSTSVSQFNETAINAAIQLGCTAGYTCSALTLDAVELAVKTSATINYSINNTSGSTGYIASIASGLGPQAAVNAGAAVKFYDGITVDLLVSNPNITVNTDTNRRNATCSSGTANRGCLTVTTAGLNINQNATGTDYAGYYDGDVAWATVLANYVGTGTKSFTLTSAAAVQPGNINFTNSTSFSGTSLATTGAGSVDLSVPTPDLSGMTGLLVNYTYSYDETIIPSGVPEPSTILLMGGALLGAGLIRRRRNSN